MQNIIRKVKSKFEGDFAKKSLFSFILKMFGLALSYTFTLLMSNLLGAEILGQYALSFTVLNMFVLAFALGIPDTMVRIGSDANYSLKYDIRKTASRTIILTSAIGAICLYLFAGSLGGLFNDQELEGFFRIAALTLLPMILLRFNFETLRGRNEIVKFGILSHVLPYFISVVGLLIAYFIFKVELGIQTIALYGLGVLISFLWSLLLTKEGKRKDKPPFPFKRLMHYSLPMLATSSFIFLMGWTDTLMLGYFNPQSDVGIYNVVIKIARIAIIMLTSINLVLAPKISELYSKNNFEELNSLIKKSTRGIFYLTAPVVAIILLANKFVLGLFGSEFVVGSLALIVIMLSQLFNALTGSVGQVMNMTGHHKKLRDFTVISVVINIVLNAILIPRHGIIGAAIATAISAVFINLISVIFVKRKLGITTYFKPFD